MSGTTPVLLIHGLWMGAWHLKRLGRRLSAEGFAPHYFRYSSLRGALDQHLAALFGQIMGLGAPTVHLVGHSLGGVLAAHLLQRHADTLPAGRAVCLGSPLRGSATARRVQQLRLDRWALGAARHALLESGLSRWEGPRELAAIAGTRRLGASLLLGGLQAPHDGTVSVEETRIDGLSAHLCLPSSHSGLVFNPEVARQTAHFLHTGRFDGPALLP